MALAAAWFETGEDAAEGAALPSPQIVTSPHTTRALTTHYVPVNDASMGSKLPDGDDLKKLKAAGLAVLPEFRSRLPRAFPVVIPWDPVAHLIWPSGLGLLPLCSASLSTAVVSGSMAC